jgi:hypothetical protein
MSKKQIGSISHGLNEMEIIEAIGDFFKIDNFSAFGYIKYKQKN